MHIPLRYYWQLVKDTVYRHLVWKPCILSSQKAVDYLLTNHASLSRFGDGELKIMFGGDINFQPFHPLLQQRLREVLLSRNPSILIGIPDVFEHLERYTPFDQRFWRYHLCWNRSRWYSFLRSDQKYANTFLSRFYSIDFDCLKAESRFAEIKRLWIDRDVLIVEGEDSKLGVGNNLFTSAKSIRRILCPSKDAFACYDRIFETISIYASESDLIVLALGPTATILSYDLSMAGYQAMDLGHIDLEYEWYLMRASDKVAVRGKFSNEAYLEKKAVCEVCGTIVDPEYCKQIVCPPITGR